MIIFNVFNGRKRIKNAAKVDATKATVTNEIATKENSHESDSAAEITSL